LTKRSHFLLTAVAALLGAMIVAALLLPRSFALAAISDLVQCALLISGTVAFLPSAVRAHGRVRLFWSLIVLGIGFWLAYQLFWTYTEVGLHRDVPDLCAWDIVLFLHFVPLMAALALRPHVPRDEYAARVGRLDFALLLVWWFYLYVLIVMPWQYVVPNVAAYNGNLDAVYNAEKLVFLGGLMACWITSKDLWRKFYAALFGMNLCYAAASTLANWAIARKVYYSGSLYDLALVAAMASLSWIGVRHRMEKPDGEVPLASTLYGVWIARCSMIAVFSLPAFAAWAMLDGRVPVQIRAFRLALTFVAALLLGVMVFVRQHLLDRELLRLLNHSRSSFETLKRLQAQILQSEKLASIGQLAGGAAHELNNPITAMLGYSDLLLSTDLSAQQRPLAAKIGQHVRRTKSLVASLISFARQTPAAKTPLDLNTLARTAVKLTQPQWETLEVEVRTQLSPGLPRVLGDSNQLLQVCLQLVANCLHLLAERGGKIVTITTQLRGAVCLLQIATEAVPATTAAQMVDAENGLALSACQGILQEHRGQISCQPHPDGAVVFQVELPATDSVRSNGKEATLPELWQSQPYA
jgi:signal transduction histidine kinase